MKHIPNKYDIITDLRRCVISSFTDDFFEDNNVKTFLAKAEENLNVIKNNLDLDTYLEIVKRFKKAKDEDSPVYRRREDLLTASVLLS